MARLHDAQEQAEAGKAREDKWYRLAMGQAAQLSALRTAASEARPKGWQWTHERQAELLARDGAMCEKHPGLDWPHGDCAGPGMPWMVEGRESIRSLTGAASEAREKALRRASDICFEYAVALEHNGEHHAKIVADTCSRRILASLRAPEQGDADGR